MWEDLPAPTQEPSIIRSLLSIQPAHNRREKPRPPPLPMDAAVASPAGARASAMASDDDASSPEDSRATVMMNALAQPTDIPALTAELDLRTASMSPFEAFVVSMMDGRSSVDEVRLLCGVSLQEMLVVLRSLTDRALVRVQPAAAPSPPVRAKPAAPPPAVAPPPDVAPPPVAAAPTAAPSAVAPPAAQPATPTPSAPTVGVASRAVVLRPSAARLAAVQPPSEPPAPAAPAAASAPAPAARTPSMPQRSSYAQPLYSSKAENQLQKALNLEARGQLDQALAVLEGALKQSKDAAPLYNRLGLVLLRERRDFQRASRCLERAVKLDPSNATYARNHMQVVAMEASFTGLRENPYLKNR